jgi:hypothetical protein
VFPPVRDWCVSFWVWAGETNLPSSACQRKMWNDTLLLHMHVHRLGIARLSHRPAATQVNRSPSGDWRKGYLY